MEVKVTKEEILSHSNDYELGKLVRKRYLSLHDEEIFNNSDEHGIAKCTLWKEDGLYKIIYSIRSLSKGYMIGYGESLNGINFTRKDEEVGVDVSEFGWDSEMIAFAERFEFKNRVYLFYCGNHYGLDGMGYAELEKK